MSDDPRPEDDASADPAHDAVAPAGGMRGESPAPADAPREGDRWLHDLRNAANSAMTATLLARRLLESGDASAALINLHRANEAFGTLARLLHGEVADGHRRR